MHVFLRREQEAGGGEVDIQICGAASTPTCKFQDDFCVIFYRCHYFLVEK